MIPAFDTAGLPSRAVLLCQWVRHALILLACFIATATHAQVKWDLPTAYAPDNFHTENILQFVADIDKATEGRLEITIYPDAVLFNALQIGDAVRGAQAQIGEILLANLQHDDILFGIDGIPFLATSYAQARKLYLAAKPVHDKLLARRGLMMLYSVPWPPQGIYSRKQIKATSDMKGMKWRAYSPSTARIAELVDAQPVIVQASGLAAALAAGAVDAFMSSSSTGYDTRADRHVGYFYDIRAALPRNAVIVNRKVFEALDQPLQDAILKAAADAEARGWKLSEEKNDWYLSALRERGLHIVKPSPQLQSELRQIGKVMLSEWIRRSGPVGHAIVADYRKR